ncbi:MAG: EAL domain-containing protein [Eubacterium sp.]|nr:EAL domain-containing protein [Eubacterium sp.]
MGRKKLALFVGQADESLQSRFITGFTKEAFRTDYDVCVFSMYRKYQDTAERDMGESNIFKLANPDFFDGIVIMKDTIQTPNVAVDLENRLHETYKGPVLVVDLESDYYDSVFIDSYTPVKELTDHLIEVHGLKDIAFLTGKIKHRHSIERMNAFLDSMHEHNLDVPKHRIIEGDFWYKSGEQCLDYLLASGRKLPEAIITANDPMAIGLCKALEEKGYRIPEDMIVVGADSSDEGQTSPKVITSYIAPGEELGVYAVGALKDIKEGKKPYKFDDKAKLLLGETCGCMKFGVSGHNERREEWGTEISEEGFYSINNSMQDNILAQTDLMGFVSTVYSYAYQIKAAKSFHLCLVDTIGQMGQIEMPPNDGYPKRMIYAVRYNRDNRDSIASIEESFETSEMLPELKEDSEEPRAFFFTPVFYENTCFGYAVVSYGNVSRSYDEVYRRWIKVVSQGLESLNRYIEVKDLRDRISEIRTLKFEKLDDEYDYLSPKEKEDYDLVEEIIRRNLLKYNFQPIVSAVDGSIYSYEALMRSGAKRVIAPLTILKYAGMQGKFSDIESATFLNVLNIIEASKDILGDAKVFINSIPGVKVDNLDEITDILSKNSDRVVVELTEEAELSDKNLEELKNLFASLNIEIAVDDYGTGYSNISNLLRYMPNYVKIDRSLLTDIQDKPQKQHFVREIIEFCHNNDIKALAEGVENSEELRTVIHLGVDLIQGYYTGRPQPEFIGKIDEKIINEIKSYHQEKTDGKSKQVFVAGKTNRISLLNLAKDEYSDIVVGKEGMVYKDITIIGTPSKKTDIHLRVESGYSGRITLENVIFSNIKNRPCIDFGENTDVTLVIEGNNELLDTGILVPESSRLTIEGKGDMHIVLTNNEYFGIGNDLKKRHGELNFLQSGKITIEGKGNVGICIGSGLGGSINIKAGIYDLLNNGLIGVGIGSISEDADLDITNCNISADLSLNRGVGIGSVEKSASVSITGSSFRFSGDGSESVGIGTLEGESCNVKISNSYTEYSIGSDRSTSIGALNGSTRLNMELASIHISSAGDKAVSVGGLNEDTVIKLLGVDTRVNIHNSLGKDTLAPDDAIEIINGRCKIEANGKEIERKLIYKFE